MRDAMHLNPSARELQRWAIVALAAIGMWQIGEGLYIHAKAKLAQVLIAHAWAVSRVSGSPVRPWPWADTYPIARLTVPAHDVDLYVLEGDSGRSLAFGPGHMTGTSLPGLAGNAVISAHRDTHFAFLRDLRAGQEINVELNSGAKSRYRVRNAVVVNQDTMAVTGDTRTSVLTLVTCYPFDAVVPRGPLRYVVYAEKRTVES
jgi:sortase A